MGDQCKTIEKIEAIISDLNDRQALKSYVEQPMDYITETKAIDIYLKHSASNNQAPLKA